MRLSRTCSPVLFAALLVACNEDPVALTDPEDVTFATELGVDLSEMTKTSSGLYYQDRVVGTGAEAAAGDFVSVRYSGWLSNGELFDSNVGGQPFNFTLGVGFVIRGWDEGVAGMRVGGKRLLVVPPGLGYGRDPYLQIPGNSVLVFEVELLSVS